MLCSRFGEHPCWQAGKRAVGLQDDCHFDVVRDETPSDDDSLTELRMVRVVDLGFRRVFAGSMPCDRAKVVRPQISRSTVDEGRLGSAQ